MENFSYPKVKVTIRNIGNLHKLIQVMSEYPILNFVIFSFLMIVSENVPPWKKTLMICGSSEGSPITKISTKLVLYSIQEINWWSMYLSPLCVNKKPYMSGKLITDSTKDGDSIKQVRFTLLKVTYQNSI